ILTLSNQGGSYQSYHFVPGGDRTNFGFGDHQLGAELMGHSRNDYTRYSISVLNGTDGQLGAPSNSYDVYADFTQGFELPKVGLQRVGVYGYFGQRSTVFQTSNGAPISGTGSNNHRFNRRAAYELPAEGKLDFS